MIRPGHPDVLEMFKGIPQGDTVSSRDGVTVCATVNEDFLHGIAGRFVRAAESG